MLVLSPEGRNALKSYLEDLRTIREGCPFIVFHDIYGEAEAYPERIEKAKISLMCINRQIREVEAVIKNFLFALDDQEIIAVEAGTVLKEWNFEDPVLADETNPL